MYQLLIVAFTLKQNSDTKMKMWSKRPPMTNHECAANKIRNERRKARTVDCFLFIFICKVQRDITGKYDTSFSDKWVEHIAYGISSVHTHKTRKCKYIPLTWTLRVETILFIYINIMFGGCIVLDYIILINII